MSRKSEYTTKIDTNIGTKIYELRIAKGLSREQLAIKIGVTHQQVQKYEKGINRISAGRLMAIANALDKSAGFFFDQIEDHYEALPTQHSRMCIEIARNFMKIKSAASQDAINILVRTLACNN